MGQSPEFDIVIANGRVLDPETQLDAVRSLGIRGGSIAAVSESPLTGRATIAADGLVVAPGFIDLHSHTQSIPGDRIQAYDGVTTTLELESGSLPVGQWYDNQVRRRRVLNYGASASWAYARIVELCPRSGEPDASFAYFGNAYAHREWQFDVATAEQSERILARLDEGLRAGGIGIGVNNGYAPGAGAQELAAVAALAARHGVPTFTHIGWMSNVDPRSSYEAYLRIISFAAATGAHMHICHLNSTSLRDIRRCAEAIRNAQGRGLPITVEAYPYGAASTLIGAAFLADPQLRERTGADWSDIRLNATGEAPASAEDLHRIQRATPDALIIWHFLHPETSSEDRDLLDISTLYPGGAIASDGMPWEMPGKVALEGDVWPIPAEAVAHPRSAATFARFFAIYVASGRIGLLDGVEKCSLIPARILQESVPQMRRKGRLQVGADADVIVFDPAAVKDNATFQEPTLLSGGMVHVLVNGTAVISGGVLDTTAFPGRAIRRAVAPRPSAA